MQHLFKSNLIREAGEPHRHFVFLTVSMKHMLQSLHSISLHMPVSWPYSNTMWHSTVDRDIVKLIHKTIHVQGSEVSSTVNRQTFGSVRSSALCVLMQLPRQQEKQPFTDTLRFFKTLITCLLYLQH